MTMKMIGSYSSRGRQWAVLLGVLVWCGLIAGWNLAYAQAISPNHSSVRSNLVLWLDANDTNTVFKNRSCTGKAGNNDRILCWKDKSGKGNHVKRDRSKNDNTAPKYLKNYNRANNKHVVDFSSSQYLLSSGVSYTGNYTIFIVLNSNDSNPDNNEAFFSAGKDTSKNVQLDYSNSAHKFRAKYGAELPFETFKPHELQLYTTTFRASPRRAQLMSNGRLVRSQANNVDNYNRIEQFRINRNRNDTRSHNSTIAEVIVYNRLLNDCEIMGINLYLGNKYDRDFIGYENGHQWGSYKTQIKAIMNRFLLTCTTNAVRITSATSNIATISTPSNMLTSHNKVLSFGHNNASLSPKDVGGTTGKGLKRMQRVWRVDHDLDGDGMLENNEDVGTVTVGFPISTADTNFNYPGQYILLVDANGDFDDGNSTIHLSPSFVDTNSDGKDDQMLFDQVTLAHGAHFTLAKLPDNLPVVDPAQTTCFVDDAETQALNSTAKGVVVWDLQTAFPGSVSANQASDYISSGSAPSFGSGLTGDSDSGAWTFTGVDTTNLALARYFDEYITFSFTTESDTTPVYLKRWGTLGTTLPVVGIDIASKSDFSDAETLYKDDTSTYSVGTTWHNISLSARKNLKPNTTYYIRLYVYNFTGTKALNSFALQLGSCTDFGDAPNNTTKKLTYKITLKDDGARHGIVKDVYLGKTVTGGLDGYPSDDADEDTGDDGVTFDSNLILGVKTKIKATAKSAGYLSAWVDFDGDGTWETTEKVLTDEALKVGENSLEISTPITAIVGTTYMRFRFTKEQNQATNPTGAAPNGEVEDYQVTIDGFDYGDAPDSYLTTFKEDGARHMLADKGIQLGTKFDVEGDGVAADPGDDAASDDSDDGVRLNAEVYPDNINDVLNVAGPNDLTVTVSKAGFLSAWIDWNQDGDFSDNNEQVFNDLRVSQGENNLTFTAPTMPLTARETYARFRVSEVANKANITTGLVSDGEVEDYRYALLAPPPSCSAEDSFNDWTAVSSGTTQSVSASGKTATLSGVGTTSQTLTFSVPLQGFVIEVGNLVQTQAYEIQGVSDPGTLTETVVNPIYAALTEMHISSDALDTVVADGVGTSSVQVFFPAAVERVTVTAVGATTSALELRMLGCEPRDYGDAPASYGTGQAFQKTANTLYLGAIQPDADSQAQISADASGDGAEDDGVTSIPALSTVTTSYTLPVTVYNSTSATASLAGWIDFNRDGVFTAAEGAVVASIASGATTANLVFTPPADIQAGPTFMRLRLSSTTLTPNMSAANTSSALGEIEDYALTISGATLGLAKHISDVISNGDGSYNVAFTLSVENMGTLPLSGLQISDNLAAYLGQGHYVIVTPPQGLGGGLSINPGFDGSTVPELLSGADTLAVGERKQLAFTVRITPNDPTLPDENSASASATSSSGQTQDISQQGLDPDPDGDGNPNNDSDPTVITYRGSALLGLSKQAGAAVAQLDGTYRTTFTLKVANYGSAEVAEVQITDDLTTMFDGPPDCSSTPTTTYCIIPGSIYSDTLTVNPMYSGDPGGSSPFDDELLFTSMTLQAGQQASLQFEVMYNPQGKTQHCNHAYVFADANLNDTLDPDELHDTSTNGSDPDGATIDDNPLEHEPTCVVSALASGLGLAKQRRSTSQFEGDPTAPKYTVEYEIILHNMSNTPLTNVQLYDDLKQTFDALSIYSVTPTLTSSDVSVNPSYDGMSNIALLASEIALAPLQRLRLMLSVEVQFNTLDPETVLASAFGPYNNQATAKATLSSGVQVTEMSTDGTEVDPDGDGDPSNNSIPTPVSFPIPSALHDSGYLVLEKEVRVLASDCATEVLGFAKMHSADPGQCLEYRITATNPGTGTITGVEIHDTIMLPTIYKSHSIKTSAGVLTTPDVSCGVVQSGPYSTCGVTARFIQVTGGANDLELPVNEEIVLTFIVQVP